MVIRDRNSFLENETALPAEAPIPTTGNNSFSLFGLLLGDLAEDLG
jgi:hypothetical protein